MRVVHYVVYRDGKKVFDSTSLNEAKEFSRMFNVDYAIMLVAEKVI